MDGLRLILLLTLTMKAASTVSQYALYAVRIVDVT